MTEKLMPCVCGCVHAYIWPNEYDFYVAECFSKTGKTSCNCATPPYETKEQAAAAWNAMINALLRKRPGKTYSGGEKTIPQIAHELRACAERWEPEACLLGNVRAREIMRLIDKCDFLSEGWTNEIPTEVGDYLFKGEIRDYAGRLCGLNVVYFVRASVKSYSKEPQFVFYPQEFFGDTKELEEHTKGHWLRIYYPDPPKR